MRCASCSPASRARCDAGVYTPESRASARTSPSPACARAPAPPAVPAPTRSTPIQRDSGDFVRIQTAAERRPLRAPRPRAARLAWAAMVASTARMAVLCALAALLALPSAAHAALDLRSCVDFREVRCASLSVPLDRAGVDPGTIDLRIGRAGSLTGPTLMYLSGGPGSAGLSEMLSVVSALPEPRGSASG